MMYLHPNMYLLIHDTLLHLQALHLNLHPNMYLLIPEAAARNIRRNAEFTSQHVSINSGKGIYNTDFRSEIYIPTCIY